MYSGATDLSSEGGFPSGRIGLYTEVDSATEFTQLNTNDDQFTRQLSSAWSASGRNPVIDQGAGDGALHMRLSWDRQTHPTMLNGVRANRFDITFSTTRRTGDAFGRACLILGYRGSTDYGMIRLSHDNDYGIHGWDIIDGAPMQTVNANAPNAVPAATESEAVWYRVTCDGTDVKVYAVKNATEPTSWNDSTDIVWETTSSTDRFDFTAEGGGSIGFAANSQVVYIDNLTVKTDRDSNGSYETTEHVDTFDLNGSDLIEEDLDYDAAGSLTFDGNLKYTYDAFNRLMKTEKAYRDAGGTVQVGSTLTAYAYDGNNRRIARDVQNSGALDGLLVYTYAGNRIVTESWSSGGDRIKYYVWGLAYIDELIQTSVYEFYDGSSVGYSNYYALLDSKFSVLGLVDEDGDYVQRYEYTPDGRRQVYLSAGTNDPDARTPTSEAPREGIYLYNSFTEIQEYSLCTIGFQGLMHDEVTGNIYQRAREYSPRLGRFMQRDPLGYPDGMNTYAAYHVMRGGVDPSGLNRNDQAAAKNAAAVARRLWVGKRKFDEHEHKLDNGRIVKVYYISEYISFVEDYETKRVQKRGNHRRSENQYKTIHIPIYAEEWTPTFITAYSYCPGHDPDREAKIENYGKQLEEGVRQDNRRHGQDQLINVLTIALHTVPGGASADYASQGDFNAAIQAGLIDGGLSLAGVGAFKVIKVAGAAKGSKAIPEYVYRGGGKNPGSLKPRPVDEGMLSVRDSLSNPWPLKPGQQPPLPVGKPIQVIDTAKLPKGTVIPDNIPPGHVSIGPNVDPQIVKNAIVDTIKVIKD